MSTIPGNFRNVVLCEDIRDELGNKKSLMGVLGADIAVPSFPTTIKVAFYIEYEVQPEDNDSLRATFRFKEAGVLVAEGKFEAATAPGRLATFVIPSGLLTVENETEISLSMAINDRPEQELLNRKVIVQG